ELRSTSRRVTGAARTLLPVHLGAGAGNLRAALRLVRTLLFLGKLPAHDALQDVLARVETEDLVRQLDLAGSVAGKRGNLDVHHSAPSVAGAVSAAGATSFLAARMAA